MADDGNKITSEDIIGSDGSLEKLIEEIKGIGDAYEEVVKAIKSGAETIAKSLKSISGATREGRDTIDDMSFGASRLQRWMRELKFSMTDTGKQVAWLKAQVSDNNKMTVEQNRYIQAAVTSYDKLKRELKDYVNLYKSLTAVERADPNMGGALVVSILDLKRQLKALDDQIKPHIKSLTDLEQAQKRLAFLQSAEGQQLLDVRSKIRSLTAARKEAKDMNDAIANAEAKLNTVMSDENEKLQALNYQIQEQNRIKKLQAVINSEAEGSYNRLSAQYALNKIMLNQMSAAEREGTDAGKQLVQETANIYKEMIRLQEATGNFRLSVGHYQKVWDGLGFSISQVVRELPALAVSANTFFLGISNNIPMMVDEINKLIAQNKVLAAEGQPTVDVMKQIIESLFGWNTALVLVLTAFSMFGDKITEWIASLIQGKKAAESFTDAMENVAKKLEKENGSYGQHIVSLKKLQSEWKALRTEAEKNQWIKDNASEFKKLDIEITNVNEAETVFVEHTEAVIKALMSRAKAAAAQKLAEEKYAEALVKRNEAELLERKKQENMAEAYKAGDVKTTAMHATPGAIAAGPGTAEANAKLIEEQFDKRIKKQEELYEVLMKEGDAYFYMADGYEKLAKEYLKGAGIEERHKHNKERDPRDLTDIINRNDITIQKKYEESVTNLLNDEYAKRKKKAADEVQNENNKLREMYRKNEEYVANVEKKWRELTEDQKEQIAQQQEWITEAIVNNLKRLDLELEKIQNEQSVNSLRIARNTLNAQENASSSSSTLRTTDASIQVNASEMERSLVEERNLLQRNLEIEYALVLDTNAKLLEEGDEHARSEEEILTELNRKKLELWSEYDQKILNARAQNIEDQLELVKKGSQEELDLLLQLNEVRRQLALAENAGKPAEQQVSTDVINAKFNRSATLTKGEKSMETFDQQQKTNQAEFEAVKHSEREITRFKLQQEKERWEQQIRLAKSGALDWSDLQVEEAENMVKGIDRKLNDLNFVGLIGSKGFGGALLDSMGFDDDYIDALTNVVNQTIANIQEIIDYEVQLAEAAKEAADARVEAAQKAYDAEIEARNNGYAHSVDTAKKELLQEKRNQQQKQKLLEQAQRSQEQIQTAMQTVSLITATAQLWSSLSGIPIIGHALALAAIASMWVSFAAAKIKAKQVTAKSEEYGEGGLEFLEGGSHASGNDIDLGVENKKKKRMRAEGGEALAIVNKKQTRHYRKMLPGIIDSLNRGTFEDKYMKAFASSDNITATLNNNVVDLTKLERDVSSIKKQNDTKFYSLPGITVIQYKNIRQIIRN